MSTCLRHGTCRRAAYDRLAAWPTATHTRYFVVTILGSLGLLLTFAYLVAAPFLLFWLATQTGEW
jgi:hypothetical protein